MEDSLNVNGKNIVSPVEFKQIRDKKLTRKFDFSKYETQKIALKVAYLGWDYDGLVTQDHTENTVEEMILRSMQKTKLIDDRTKCCWSRCGRTDKGVSGFKQVFSCIVRSNKLINPSTQPTTPPLNYVHMMNRTMPEQIRVLAWAPVCDEFDARFSCTKRVYHYYLPHGALNIEKMREAGENLVGTHDFRNMCKLAVNSDKTDVKPTVRTVHSVKINQIQQDACDVPCDGYNMHCLKVEGSGFLHHQIRCIVSLLLEIGRGNENPSLIGELLDVSLHPRKPQYSPALQLPLVLFDTQFSDNLDWRSESSLSTNVSHLQRIWAQHQTKATIIKQMIQHLVQEAEIEPTSLDETITDYLDPGPRPHNYIRICDRPSGDGPQEKRRKLNAKSQLNVSHVM